MAAVGGQVAGGYLAVVGQVVQFEGNRLPPSVLPNAAHLKRMPPITTNPPSLIPFPTVNCSFAWRVVWWIDAYSGWSKAGSNVASKKPTHKTRTTVNRDTG